jgi:transcriptional regulator with XRE-family HTH domain
MLATKALGKPARAAVRVGEGGASGMMKEERSFGRLLRATRVQAGLSQSDLEEISGIPKARLSRYENGHVAPSIQTLARLAKALKVSEASLLGDERVAVEDFFKVLRERGVPVTSPRQAASLANAVADMWQALATDDEAPDGETISEPKMASLGSWVSGGTGALEPTSTS